MSRLNQWIPSWLKAWYRQSDWYVRHRSQNQNIYHCTVQKSASQWMRGLLGDERTYRHCGLRTHDPEQTLPGGIDSRKITARTYPMPFPPHTLATPIYVDYDGFASIPKPPHYKAFFVMRDPRDVVVSWYFSIRFSHEPIGEIERIRRELTSLSEPEGILYSIDFLHDYGLFAAQRSWADAPSKDPHVMLVRHEDLTGPRSLTAVEQLFAHCDIRMPRPMLAELLDAHSFEKLSGRKPGQEDPSAHYRKGVAGDWRNHFAERIQARFTEVAGDVLGLWKYA